MYNKILIKSCCIFASVAGDVAAEFKWYYDFIRNPQVTFKGHVDSSEAIQIDESFVEIHAEQEYEPASTRPGMNMDPNTNMDLLMDMDTDTGFEFLNRRPPRSQMPRLTNREQLNRGSCFF